MKPCYSTKRDGESANGQELKYPSKTCRAASRPEVERSARLNSLGSSVTKKKKRGKPGAVTDARVSW